MIGIILSKNPQIQGFHPKLEVLGKTFWVNRAGGRGVEWLYIGGFLMDDILLARRVLARLHPGIREPDEDLRSAFEYNYSEDSCDFKIDEIVSMLARVQGENDEYNWHWVVSLRDGRLGYVSAGCDYTGWD